MATDDWVTFGDVELINLSRTAQLAEVMGIDTLWVTPESTAWIQAALSGVDYDDITTAPWYDSAYPASAEFAGLISLGLTGLDDSTLEASTVEYITNGGKSGTPRNSTLSIVASIVIIASTDRGADYGKRWMDRVLSTRGTQSSCSGAELHYFTYRPVDGETPPIAHRRDVTLTRGTSVTRKRRTDCSATWWVTYTWTANDPFEYGEPLPQFTALGGGTPVGPGVDIEGEINLIQNACPVFDYSPIYDPLHPALVPPPAVPNFYPTGWDITDGDAFTRHWVRLDPIEPTALGVVPVFTLSADSEARTLRVSIWPSSAEIDEQCDPLFSAVVTYMPALNYFVIDGEQQASYVWNGSDERVRRADSLVFSPQAEPVDWTKFNDPLGLLVTLDLFAGSSSQDVRAALEFVPKSD